MKFLKRIVGLNFCIIQHLKLRYLITFIISRFYEAVGGKTASKISKILKEANFQKLMSSIRGKKNGK